METSTGDDLSFNIVKCLPEEICDNIFANLEGRDLLVASLVAKEWYNYIAKSAVCMQKLTLYFSPNKLKETRLVMVKRNVLNSDRKYGNIDFEGVNFIGVRDILQTRGRKWKKVTMWYMDFPTVLDFVSLIAIVEPFVEELDMYCFYISSDNPKKRKLSKQPNKSLTFPKLKFLDLWFCQDSIIEVFQDVVTLTEFNFESSSSTVTNAIQKIIRYNKELKKLTTVISVFDQIICGEISSDITFKLTSLRILEHYSPFELSERTKTRIQKNVKQFLELQMKTLETLSLDRWMGLETVKVIFHMPKLKHLSLDGVDGFHHVEEPLDWKEISFKQRLSLISLDLNELGLNIDQLRAFITAAPNVKKLDLYLLEDESIACISKLLPNLESLSVDKFEVLDVTEKSYLPNLKKFSMMHYAQGIKESEAEEDRSKFERLFLERKKCAWMLKTE